MKIKFVKDYGEVEIDLLPQDVRLLLHNLIDNHDIVLTPKNIITKTKNPIEAEINNVFEGLVYTPGKGFRKESEEVKELCQKEIKSIKRKGKVKKNGKTEKKWKW